MVTLPWVLALGDNTINYLVLLFRGLALSLYLSDLIKLISGCCAHFSVSTVLMLSLCTIVRDVRVNNLCLSARA